MIYKPPPVRETFECPVDFGVSGVRMFWRQDVYKGKVVDFCIELQVRDPEDSSWTPMFRVDTSHGELHHHQYYKSGKESVRTVDQEIPDRGWETVDNAWDVWLESMMESFEAYWRRWERG